MSSVDSLCGVVASLMVQARADLAELVAFRSVANPEVEPPSECAKAAQWVIDAFTEAGLSDVIASPTPDGSRCVHGVAPGPPGSPTVLLYCHYDVQPPLDEDAWHTPVWELTERDGRWYARGAADCKGNIVAHLTAPRALSKQDGGFPCTVKLVAEGSEEQGTGGLEKFVPEHADLLAADTILVADTGNFAAGVPTLTTTLLGMATVDVRLSALSSAMHSGMFGGPAPDPVVAMVQLLATLHDEHGNTTVDGLDATETWQGVDYPAETFRADANVLDGVELMNDGSVADLLWARPTATVLGMDIPSVASSSAAVQALVEHLRKRVPWGLRCRIDRVATGDPFVGSIAGPAFEAMRSSMEDAFEHPMTTEGQGGSIPLCTVFAETFPDAEIMLLGVEEPKCLIHAPNESVDSSEIEHLALAEALFLTRYAASWGT